VQIRHGEFQFKVVRLGAKEIAENCADLLVKGEMVYVATDEQDKAAFFEPLWKAGYELRFLDDYFEAAGLKGLESNMLGMVDTLVASQGRHFIGTWFSTFSGYIIRLRGYAARHHHHLHRLDHHGHLDHDGHHDHDQLQVAAPDTGSAAVGTGSGIDGGGDGGPSSSSSSSSLGAGGVGDNSFYFFLKKKYAMRSREAPSDPFYTREWPTAWEDIDA
jgi:hypothetical protein